MYENMNIFCSNEQLQQIYTAEIEVLHNKFWKNSEKKIPEKKWNNFTVSFPMQFISALTH